MRRTRTFALVAFCMCLAAPSVGSKTQDGPLDRIGWLAGCWELRHGDRTSQEQWMAPLGGTMVGMSRTVVGDKTVGYEFLRIEERDGRLAYVASPSGQTTTVFEQVALGDSMVTFENPTHDFPQRLKYRLLADGSILAQAIGRSGDQERTIDFPLRRVSCDRLIAPESE